MSVYYLSVLPRHLLVNPRDRRVLIIESILCPSHFRETLTKVFFKQFEVLRPAGPMIYVYGCIYTCSPILISFFH